MSEERDYGDEDDYARIETKQERHEDRIYHLKSRKTTPDFHLRAFGIPFVHDSSIPEGEIHLKRFGTPITKLVNFKIEETNPLARQLNEELESE
jgi:hypothetical protein